MYIPRPSGWSFHGDPATFLACALAHRACREGHPVRYLRLHRFLQDLQNAQIGDPTLADAILDRLMRVAVLRLLAG